MAAVRRLSAIMFTDMVGSTALAQSNEARSFKLREEQEELIRPLFAAHRGREIKSLGDGFLAEFDSALSAVQCAIDIQYHLHERNSQPGVVPILLRIGVHLGDVEQRGGDIFGDAVNIASRIEPLAPPRGVCISGEVFSQIRNKIPNKLEKLPPVSLKGVQVAIDLYNVVLPWAPERGASAESGATGIAVLPFANISPDPKDEYFADGLTEEMISVLSQLPGLLVIARTSVMPYKSSPKGVGQIGSELGVTAILEGSVRKAGEHLRVTVQLIDVATQGHTWAQNYDRKLDDIFAVQSEIAGQVAQALRVRIGRRHDGSASRASIKTDSYLAYLRGLTLLREESRDSIRKAHEEFARAIELDPLNAQAYAGLADATRFLGWFRVDARPRAEWDRESREFASRALELEPNLADAHSALALILWDDFEWAACEREFRTALAANPSSSWAHRNLSIVLSCLGRMDESIRESELAVASDPLTLSTLGVLAQRLCWTNRLDEGDAVIARMRKIDPFAPMTLDTSWEYCIARGDFQGARELCAVMLEHHPEHRVMAEAWTSAATGEVGRARELIRELERRRDLDRSVTEWEIASLFALIGDLDECFHWIDLGMDRLDIPIQFFRTDPLFARFRADPRYHALLVRQKLA